jgi:hypothetical protein
MKASRSMIIGLLLLWMVVVAFWASFLMFSDTSHYGWPLTFATQQLESPDSPGHYYQVEIHPTPIIFMCAASLLVGFVLRSLWPPTTRGPQRPN